MRQSTGSYQAATFIVRLWRESDQQPGRSVDWRGVAVHVQSGAERAVHDTDDVINFIQAWLGADKPDELPDE